MEKIRLAASQLRGEQPPAAAARGLNCVEKPVEPVHYSKHIKSVYFETTQSVRDPFFVCIIQFVTP